jgi:hypothetical protein
MNVPSWISSLVLIVISVGQLTKDAHSCSCDFTSFKGYNTSLWQEKNGKICPKGEVDAKACKDIPEDTTFNYVTSRLDCLTSSSCLGFALSWLKLLIAFGMPYFVETAPRLSAHAILNILNVHEGWFTLGSRTDQVTALAVGALVFLGAIPWTVAKRGAKGRYAK